MWSKIVDKRKRAKPATGGAGQSKKVEETKKKKKKTRKVESLSAKVKDSPKSKTDGFGSLDDWLC